MSWLHFFWPKKVQKVRRWSQYRKTVDHLLHIIEEKDDAKKHALVEKLCPLIPAQHICDIILFFDEIVNDDQKTMERAMRLR